ncbi:hypothetical protein C0J26_18395 [Pseudomonas baetica]|nr:hypothetical protein C0J26_18395 [Pseudomonas baetica]
MADPQNVPQQIRRISAATKREAFRRSGNQCAFPGCEASLLSPNGAIVGEFCNIESLSSGGPRYNACSGLMKPDTHLGENARQIEVSDDQTTSFFFR